eukprot:3205584-Rhodomonas_salina.1
MRRFVSLHFRTYTDCELQPAMSVLLKCRGSAGSRSCEGKVERRKWKLKVAKVVIPLSALSKTQARTRLGGAHSVFDGSEEFKHPSSVRDHLAPSAMSAPDIAKPARAPHVTSRAGIASRIRRTIAQLTSDAIRCNVTVSRLFPCQHDHPTPGASAPTHTYNAIALHPSSSRTQNLRSFGKLPLLRLPSGEASPAPQHTLMCSRHTGMSLRTVSRTVEPGKAPHTTSVTVLPQRLNRRTADRGGHFQPDRPGCHQHRQFSHPP